MLFIIDGISITKMLLHNRIIRYDEPIDILQSLNDYLNIVKLIKLSFDFAFQMGDC